MKFLFIIIAILILLLMITIHEFGHYITGKILGFKIDEFSIGFGPKLFQKKKKDGELFSIRLLPLGGYCAFSGETEEEKILAPEKMKGEPFEENASDDKSAFAEKDEKKDEMSSAVGASEHSEIRESEDNDAAKDSEKVESETKDEKVKEKKKFNEQPPWKRIIVLMAGGVFNLLSAVVFSFIFIAVAGADKPTITKIYPDADGSEYVGELREGDEVLEIDGYKIDFFHTVAKALSGKKEGDEIVLTVNREGKEITVTTIYRKYDYEGREENVPYPVGMGIASAYSRASIGDAFLYCVPYTGELSWLILGTFGDLIVGKVPLSQVSGPIGTVNQMANYGMENAYYLLLLLPLIAANLGIFNLFPIPALDGSKVVFTIIEWIRGKPVNPKVESMIHFVGLIVLFGLVIILDIVNLVLGAV